jgi:hypothetical protein
MFSPSEVIGGIDRAVSDPNRRPAPVRLVDIGIAWSTVAVLIGCVTLGPFLVAIVGDAMLVNEMDWSEDQSAAYRAVALLGMGVAALPHNKFVGLYAIPLLGATWFLQTLQSGFRRDLLRLLGVIVIAVQLSMFVW